MTRLWSGLLAAGLLFTWASLAPAQEVTMKFGHAATSTHLFHSGTELFASKVADKTGGKVKIEVFGDRQLGDDGELLQGIQLGTIDGALVSAPVLPLKMDAPAFDALQLPFLVQTYEQMAAALASPVGQKMLDSLDAQGIKGLGYIEAGQRHFLSAPKQVETVDDFANLKTRIVPTPLHKATWTAVGAAPVGLAFGEVYSALETKTIDAVEMNLSSIKAESLYQSAKHVTLTGHYFWPGVLMINKAKFESLPADVQAAMIEAGHETIAEQYKMAAEDEAGIRKFLEENGVTVTELAELDKMQEKTQPVLDEWIGKDPLIKEFADAVKAANSN
ncbi:MAG: TRAP transporter substrate-binding protein [Phyllobacteriaceae bacterium]|nr:TRAP transporter substrate-binding protein [Nitratireductor sp.]MCO5134246.1 TRAP transporter substrate-binding protein [Phyllobacteriaceae bacterium]